MSKKRRSFSNEELREWLLDSDMSPKMKELLNDYEFTEEFGCDAVCYFARVRRRRSIVNRLHEAFRGYWDLTIYTLAQGTPLFIILGIAFSICLDHRTAGSVLRSALVGVFIGLGFWIIFKFSLSVPEVLAENGRIAKWPITVGSAAGILFFWVIGGATPMFSFYDFVGKRGHIASWIAAGALIGGCLGLVTAVLAQCSGQELETAWNESDKGGKDEKVVSRTITAVLFLSSKPKALLGLPLGAFAGALWGALVFSARILHIGPAANLHATSTLISFLLLGTIVGFCSSACLTPGEIFFRAWSKERLCSEGKIVGLDGKPWDGNDTKDIVEMNFSETEIRERDFRFFGRNGLPNLTRLSVKGCRYLGDNWMETIGPLPSLQELDLDWTYARGYWLPQQAQNLQYLKVLCNRLGTRFELLGLYPKLERIDILRHECPKASLDSLERQRKIWIQRWG
jgi:hypothetical protein